MGPRRPFIPGDRPILGPRPRPGTGIKDRPVPGRRCPNCLSKGQTVWVIPGKHCPQCKTAVN